MTSRRENMTVRYKVSAKRTRGHVERGVRWGWYEVYRLGSDGRATCLSIKSARLTMTFLVAIASGERGEPGAESGRLSVIARPPKTYGSELPRLSGSLHHVSRRHPAGPVTRDVTVTLPPPATTLFPRPLRCPPCCGGGKPRRISSSGYAAVSSSPRPPLHRSLFKVFKHFLEPYVQDLDMDQVNLGIVSGTPLPSISNLALTVAQATSSSDSSDSRRKPWTSSVCPSTFSKVFTDLPHGDLLPFF